MASWPFEIFDRLPLLYNTLSQYREDPIKEEKGDNYFLGVELEFYQGLIDVLVRQNPRFFGGASVLRGAWYLVEEVSC